MRKVMSQTLITLLMLDAALVAGILISGRTAWPWIVIYWITLSAKNFVDWLPAHKKCKGGRKNEV